MTLSVLGRVYSGWCRILRNLFKWSPEVIEKMPIERIVSLVEESVQDNEKGRIKTDEFE